MSGTLSPAVLVACDDLILLDEVIRHLEEVPQWRLVLPAQSAEDLLRGIEANSPDVVVISEGIAFDLAHDPRVGRVEPGLVIFSRQETTDVLRAGLILGAQGFVAWPQERFQLKSLVEQGLVKHLPPPSGAGIVHAVWAPKGGAGASVISAHLAACMASAGKNCLLMDLDLHHGDQASILGAESETKTVLDLLRVGDELSAPMVQNLAWAHPSGLKVILSPGRAGEAELVKPSDISRVIRTVREVADHLVLDVPSTLNELSLAVLHEASTIVLVVTPDLLGLRRAQAAVNTLRSSGIESSRFHPVLNQAGGPDISNRDLSQVLELGKATKVNGEFRIYRATNRGELSASCSRMVGPLAKRLSAMQPFGAASPAPSESMPVRSVKPVRARVRRPGTLSRWG